jgi:hypothetical protein
MIVSLRLEPFRAKIFNGLALVCAALLSVDRVYATSFNISDAQTTAQTLGPASGETGTITDTGSLTVSGSTVAVTISGTNATVTNLGTLKQTGTGRGIFDNASSGLMITNGSSTNSSALIQTADADVIRVNGGGVTLNNYGTLTSLNASGGGSQAIDFNPITSGSNIINNYSTGVIQASEADAVRPGVNGVIYNAGLIKSTTNTGSSSDGVDAQNNSGVQITNDTTGVIEGARHGITGGAVNSMVTFTTSVTNNLGSTIQGDNGSGINLDGFNANQTATIINHGSITGNGVTGDGDGVDVDGVVNLTNTGTIKSLNSAAAPAGSPPAQSEGVTVGGGTITNSGTIEGDVATGNSNAVGRGITLAGIDTSGTPEPIYANSVITNQNGGLIKGQSDSAIAVDGGASGFTVTINNQAGATIEGGGPTAAAIRTAADNDTINDAGTIEADSSGKAIDMGAGNNALNITGGAASIIGDINGGVGGTNTMTIDPGTNNSFSYAGSISNFNTVKIESGTVTFTGSNVYTGGTTVDGGTLVAGGSGALGGTSSITINTGGSLQLAATGDRINDNAVVILSGGKFDTAGLSETVGTLRLTVTSIIDLGTANSILRFARSAAIAWTGTLNVYNWTGSPLGSGIDQLYFGTDATGLTNAQLTEINFYSGEGTGFLGTATILSDGEVVPVAAVPEPRSIDLIAAAILFAMTMVWRERRRCACT